MYLYSVALKFPMLAIRLPEEIEARLADLAAKSGRTKTWYVREAILRYLDDLEDLHRAEAELRKVHAGRSKTTLLADVLSEHGLDP